jgi:hypothetical protein
MVQYFPRLFEAVAERWPVAIKCKHEFERLLEPVWDEFVSFNPRAPPVASSTSPSRSYSDCPGGVDAVGVNEIGGGAAILDTALFNWDSNIVADSVFDLSAFTALPFDVTSAVPQDWLEEFDFQSFDGM